ncbi:uncharacterized protein VP01_15524g1, partial [Puccinia sorghi]
IVPRLFLSLPISVPNITPSFLINSGATHNILSDSYARCLGLLSYETPSHNVSGFDGSTPLPPLKYLSPPTMKSPTPMIITNFK